MTNDFVAPVIGALSGVAIAGGIAVHASWLQSRRRRRAHGDLRLRFAVSSVMCSPIFIEPSHFSLADVPLPENYRFVPWSPPLQTRLRTDIRVYVP